MNAVQRKQKIELLPYLLVGMLVFFLEFMHSRRPNGSLLITLSFWTGVVQGCIALAACVEVASSKWINPVKQKLLSVYPLLLFLSIVFPFLSFNVEIYPWVHEHGFWFDKRFFITRNCILLLLSYVFAKAFRSYSISQNKRKTSFAVLYLLIFVASQSFMAFDVVMSLEYPWLSTLFGGQFFVEALYAGLAFAAASCITMMRTTPKASPELKGTFNYSASMLFGFSLLWVYLVFSQYLIIWYGNLPEETSFLLKRLSMPPYLALACVLLFILFLFPFIALLFKKVKSHPGFVFVICVLILTGLLLERIFLIAPKVHVYFIPSILELTGVGYLFFRCFYEKGKVLA